MFRPAPNLLDVTIRDGSYLIKHQFAPEEVAQIAKGLEQAGIEYAEISHGCGVGAKFLGHPGLVPDDELMDAAQAAAPKLKISAFFAPYEQTLPLIAGVAEYIDLARIGVNVDQVSSVKKIVQKLKKFHKKVSIQLVRSHRRSPDFVAKAAKQAEKLGADVVYLVDTVGSMTPEDVKTYLEAIGAKVKIDIGFHGHNHSQMAVANAITAWETGANWIDASLLGMGRGPGNTVLEIFVELLQEKNLLKEIDLAKLCQASEQIILPLFRSPPTLKLIDQLEAKYQLDWTDPQLFELMSNFFHLSLEEIFQELEKKRGDEVQLGEAHIKKYFKEKGIEFEEFAKLLRQA